MIIIDFILNFDVYLGEIIANYGKLTYGILFAIIFAETGLVFAPFLPGDSLLFTAGMFAAKGSFNIAVLTTILFLAAFLGDNTNYWIGYHFGKKIVENKYIPINQEHINKTQEFYHKHGGKTVFWGRFMPIIRTFAPFVAGIGKMRYTKFVAYSFSGGVSWVFSFALAGYFFGNIPIVKDNFTFMILAIITVSLTPTLIKLMKDRLERKKKDK